MPRARVAEYSATGTVTRPKVIVPVQNERIPLGAPLSTSSSSATGCSLFRRGGLRRRQARRQRIGDLFVLDLARPEHFHLLPPAARGLGLDELLHPRPVFVAILRRIEFAMQ